MLAGVSESARTPASSALDAKPSRPILGAFSALLMVLNMLVWVPLLLVVAVVRLVIPIPAVRRALAPVLSGIAEAWAAGNSAGMALTQNTRWDVSGFEGLKRDAWYMVCCNHQSWVDIVVLQHLTNRRIPMLRLR